MSDQDKLKSIVNSSGFPLQIGIEHLVNETTDKHGWRVLSREHSWSNKNTNSSGFIDLLLIDRFGTSLLVIECKRVLDSSWIFLVPSETVKERRQIKTWLTRINQTQTKYFDWTDVNGDPASVESEFCVMLGQDAKSKPMLERVAGELVEATEGFAYEEHSLIGNNLDELRMYFNVIVTTAKLKVCSFPPSKITLETGMLDSANFIDVPYVRFRKQFSTNHEFKDIHAKNGFSGVIRAKENTIFVVNALHLEDFMMKFELDDRSISRMFI
jgi:hypothetical protein